MAALDDSFDVFELSIPWSGSLVVADVVAWDKHPLSFVSERIVVVCLTLIVIGTLVEWTDPDCTDTETLDVVELAQDARQVADTVTNRNRHASAKSWRSDGATYPLLSLKLAGYT